MNRALMPLLLVWLALAFGAGAQASPLSAPAPRPRRCKGAAADTARLAGREYVRLADWARANGFALRWVKRDETLQLNRPGSNVLLTLDSREAGINGLQVWLLFPVVQRNGGVYLSQLDVQTTLRPILSPPKNQRGAEIKTICLDPGHGGKDPGNLLGSHQEKLYTLLLAQEVRDQLKRAGFRVVLTRSADRFIELPDRPALANQRKADLFVSLHFNAVESARGTVQGAQVFCLTPAGASSTNARGEGGGAGWCVGNRHNDRNLFLAYQVQKTLIRGLAVEDLGVRRARFAVLRDAAMPAVLIEAGFMSHPVEGRKILTSTYRRQIARAIVEGLVAYKRAVE